MGVEEKNRLAVDLAGFPLDNPVMNASGTYGFGYELSQWIDANIMGTIVLKGTTLHARVGNETPRIAETPSGMLNAVGLQNPGVDAVIAEQIPKLDNVFHKQVVANVAGFSIEEYVETAKRFDACEKVGLIELNISCPNVHGGGMEFGTTPELAAEVTAAVKSVVSKPLFIKLTPNVTSIPAIARAVEEAGADGLTLINTLKGMRIDLHKRAPLLANGTGGLSGPAVFPIAVRMVYEAYEATNLPIIGVGGISEAEDALEMILAGATAVQIGAAGFRDPAAWIKTVHTLPSLLDATGFATIREAIGAAHGDKRRRSDQEVS